MEYGPESSHRKSALHLCGLQLSLRSLTALEMTQVELATRTGLSLKHVNQIIQGVAPVTPDTALLLEKTTGVQARMWNSLEATYREHVLRAESREALLKEADWLKELPIAELKKRELLPDTNDKGTLLEAVCDFFRVADRKSWEDVWRRPLASFRQSPSFAADAGAVSVWLRLGELEAEEIDCEPFDPTRFRDALSEIRELTTWKDVAAASQRLVELCKEAGVAIVFVAEIGKTRSSGAARWLTPTKALIQLSLRHKFEDHLWFSFFHEAGHILLHSKKETFINTGGKGAPGTDGAMEDEANRFAANQLIPRHHDSRLPLLHTDADVKAFAREIGIAPGIVVGRLQKEKLWGWNRGNNLKRKLMLVDN
jgi:HTH-type transcriptional regulator / antitoxin HigA